MVVSVYTFDDSKCVAHPTGFIHSGSSLTLLQRLCSVGGFQSTLCTSRVIIKNNLSQLVFPKTLKKWILLSFLDAITPVLLSTQRQNLILLLTGSIVLLRVLWASIKRKPHSKWLSKEPVMSSQNVNPEIWLICDFWRTLVIFSSASLLSGS